MMSSPKCWLIRVRKADSSIWSRCIQTELSTSTTNVPCSMWTAAGVLRDWIPHDRVPVDDRAMHTDRLFDTLLFEKGVEDRSDVFRALPGAPLVSH